MREWAFLFCTALLYAASAGGGDSSIKTLYPSAFAQNFASAERIQARLAPHSEKTRFPILAQSQELYDAILGLLASPLSEGEKHRELESLTIQYLSQASPALSPAPSELVLRRSAILLKPYFTLYRTLSQKPGNVSSIADWWRRSLLEALIQENRQEAVRALETAFHTQVRGKSPEHFYLARELMPKFTERYPELAHILDNASLLRSALQDIQNYPRWNQREKGAEIRRVIESMSKQAGDLAVARRFWAERDEAQPGAYRLWSRSLISEIHQEILEEMLPFLGESDLDTRRKLYQHLRLKLRPGLQEGEGITSLVQEWRLLFPGLMLPSAAHEPGETPRFLVALTVKAWDEKN